MKITEITAKPILLKRIKAAAYARVSIEKDAMLHSLSAQVSQYSRLIQSNPEWEYVGVYADEARSGTKDNRENFQRMLDDCRTGKIDLIITKSISRFARNTVTLLSTVRELKDLNIDVYFEEQNIHSISTDGELMLSIFASFAQEEALSVSENMKWRIRKNFEEGKPWNGKVYGYRMVDGQYIVVPEQAQVVKKIYSDYLSGLGKLAISNSLNDAGIPTLLGKQWTGEKVMKILKNYSYTGNLVLQKTYRDNYLTKKRCVNSGELPKYRADETHEAIIPLETFELVQDEIKRRQSEFVDSAKPKIYPFSGLIVCSGCGKHFTHKINRNRSAWRCVTYDRRGKAYCNAKQIPDDILRRTTLEVLAEAGLEPTLEDLSSKLTEIHADSGNKLTFLLKNGELIAKEWVDHSRADSWTEDMRQSVRARNIKLREDKQQREHL